MNRYLFEPTVMSLPIDGSASRFPVRRVWCVGRNYADHAREMGADPRREAPFFFAKPADALVPEGGALPYPPGTSDLQHEVELVLAIGCGGAAIAADRALDHVLGYAVGIDLTRRDLQRTAKARGQPWEMGKAFDRSAPISRLVPVQAVGHPRCGTVRLTVNGVERQRGDLADMILPPAELIAGLSRLVELAPGDIVFTGTPAGVGPLVIGDRAWAGIEGIGELAITVVSPV